MLHHRIKFCQSFKSYKVDTIVNPYIFGTHLDYIKQNSILFMDSKTLADGTVDTWTSSSSGYSYTASKVSATGPVKSASGLLFNNSEYMRIPNLNLSGALKYSVYIVHTLAAKTANTRAIFDFKASNSLGYILYNPNGASYLYFGSQTTSFAGMNSGSAGTGLTGTKVVLETCMGTLNAESRNNVNNGSAVTFTLGSAWQQLQTQDFFIGAHSLGVYKYVGNIDCIIIMPFETPENATITKLWLSTYYGISM